ncbi:MAG: CPP1-like family protein [Cyanobium sp.]
MTQGSDPTSDPTPSPQGSGFDPYDQLGVDLDASFEAVQGARQRRLNEVGDDPIARAGVEASYDAILMNRLRERQQGRVSTAARSASQREQVSGAPAPRADGPALPRLPQLPAVGLPRPSLALPSLELATGRERWLPLAVGGVVLVLLLALSAPPAELLLSLMTLTTLLNLQRRRGRFLPALGWSFALLCAGLLLGGLLASSLDPALPLGLPISLVQVQAIPALLLLLLGALLIA